MLLRRFTDFVLQGRVQTMALAFVCAFVPLIGSIGILMAALITLRKNAFDGVLVTLAATVPYLLAYIGYPAEAHTDVTLLIIVAMCASNLLTWLGAVVLRRHGNWSLVIEAATFLGVLCVVAIHLMSPDIQQWWQTQLTDYFTKNAALMDVATRPDVAAIQADLVQRAKVYATGLTVTSVLFNALLQLALARWWQAVMFNPGGLRTELWRIRLGYAAVILLAILFGLALFDNQTSLDALTIQFAAFGAAGLSLIHCLIGTTQRLQGSGWVVLMLVYAATIFLFPLSAVIITVIALLDTLFDFRKRLGKLTI